MAGRSLLAVLALMLIAGCRENVESGGSLYAQRGVSVVLPAGWSVIGSGWTQLTTPTRIGFSSFATARDLEGDCVAAEVTNAMPADGVALFLIDYGPDTSELFPARPRRFTLDGRELIQFGCFGPSYAWYFRVEGRSLQAHLAPGPEATEARIEEGLSILDSLKLARP